MSVRYLCLLGLWMFPAIGFTSILSISPIHIYFNPGEKIVTLALKNSGLTPIIIQAQIYSWSQQNQRDIYQPTQAVLVSPPLIRIPPDSRQLMRLALIEQQPLRSEQRTYRLVLTEVTPSKVRQIHHKLNLVTVRLKFLLPIFVNPVKIEHKVIVTKNYTQNLLQIQVHNLGNATIFIDQLQLFSASYRALMKPYGAFTYILPGQIHLWSFNAVSHAAMVKIRLDSKFENYMLLAGAKA